MTLRHRRAVQFARAEGFSIQKGAMESSVADTNDLRWLPLVSKRRHLVVRR
jgi:hypothetical protein